MTMCRCLGPHHVCQPGEEKEMIERWEPSRMGDRIMNAFNTLPTHEEGHVILRAVVLRHGSGGELKLTKKDIKTAFDDGRNVYIETSEDGVTLRLK